MTTIKERKVEHMQNLMFTSVHFWKTMIQAKLSRNFSVRGYLPLIRKDYIIHLHDLAVYVKEGLPFGWGLSLENSSDSYLCFWLALLQSVSYFFFLYWWPSSLYTVFDSISSNIDDVLSIKLSANVFVFGDFNIRHKDWLIYSRRTERPGELWSQMTLLRC